MGCSLYSLATVGLLPNGDITERLPSLSSNPETESNPYVQTLLATKDNLLRRGTLMSIYCLPHVVEKLKVLTISSLPVLMQSYDKAAWRRANTPSHEVLNPEFLFIGNLKKMIKLYPFRITQGITLLMCMNNPNCIPLGLYGYYGNLVKNLLLI